MKKFREIIPLVARYAKLERDVEIRILRERGLSFDVEVRTAEPFVATLILIRKYLGKPMVDVLTDVGRVRVSAMPAAIVAILIEMSTAEPRDFKEME